MDDLFFNEPNPKGKIPYVRSTFMKEKEIFLKQVKEFCRSGRVHFDTEYDSVRQAVNWLIELFDPLQAQDMAHHARGKYSSYKERIRTSIRAIPCEDPDTILPEKTPYDTYFLLRAMVRKATDRIQFFDSYLIAAVFHRYLRELPDGIEITIVTGKDIMELLKSGSRRRDEIIAISELLAAQYPDSYRFLVADFHDRWVRVDQDIFHMGGSFKDASKDDMYTISNLDSTSSIDAKLDETISSADEWFGPTNQEHRRD